ncbi:hypothetical protein [Flavicella sediminum]|uniref:hypothetical protein n=1 Tax=Flavicella sediminum TaxID=2585141 RepID=UPI00140CE7D0|nr:hypothetical protein [Flavicella sediminum]
MCYSLEILKDELREIEEIQVHCLRNGNQTDSDQIQQTRTQDLKAAIRLLEFYKNQS